MQTERFDVIVIGGGLGGMVCAALLGMEGYKVLVLDKNRQIGGNLQVYVRDKTVFDSGVHYVGCLGEGESLHKIFTYLGIYDGLKFRQMDLDGFDNVLFKDDDNIYPLSQGYERFVENLTQFFPEEREGLNIYVEGLKYLCNCFPLYQLREGSAFDKVSAFGIGAKDFIEERIKNPVLRNVLGGNNMLYAGKGGITPAFVHALVTNSYIESSWRPYEGGSQITRQLTKVIRSHGGVVKNKSKVVKIVEEGGKATSVILENGDKYEADRFISNIHPAQTMELIDSEMIRTVYRARIKSLENSVSVFMINIVFEKNTVLYKNHNFYYYEDKDVWNAVDYTAEQWPRMYGLFYNASMRNPVYTDGATVMTYMDFKDVEPWADTFNVVSQESERSESYQVFKKEKAEKLLALVFQRFPELKGHIRSYSVATPLSYRDYIGTEDGSLYGIVKDYNDPMRTLLAAKTKIPNLFLTGQNLNLHGILGVTISALVTISEFIPLNDMLAKINAKSNDQ